MNEPKDQVESSKPDEKQPCVVCREPILLGAKVCNHCRKAQNWTRHLTRWGTMVGAGVASLSLVSGAFSLRELMTDPAKLRVIPKDCQRRSLELAVTNLGDKPAMVRRAILELKLDGTVSGEEMPLTVSEGEEIIAPHDTHRIIYKRMVHDTPADFFAPLVGVTSCGYIVSVETVDFEGNTKSLMMTCPCPAS